MNPLFRFLEDLENFIFPPFCPICDNELKRSEIICQRCFDKIYFVSRKKCKICGKPTESGKICKVCRKKNPYFDFVISCGSYVPPFSDIIKTYKYCNRPSLSKRLARKLYSHYNSRSDIKEINHFIEIYVKWYNNGKYHSSIKTFPEERYSGNRTEDWYESIVKDLKLDDMLVVWSRGWHISLVCTILDQKYYEKFKV